MYGINQYLFLSLSLMLLFQHSTSQGSRYSKCPDTGKPVTKSIKACWDYTKSLETTLVDKANVNTDVCLDVKLDNDNHQLGVEIMRTSKIIYCFGIFQASKFSWEEFTRYINGIWISKSEIMENPDICVLDGDYKDLQCMEMDLTDFNALYIAVIEQTRLLEGLFVGTN